MSYPIFVIGTGRSGTHWLGYSLGDHPEVRATIEVKPIFQMSTQMALNPSLESKLFDDLVSAYHAQIKQSGSRIYLDKSHPNIWLVEKLKNTFPNARFIGIERNPYATVASMLRHNGVLSWHERWHEFPVPNKFLGITEDLAVEYDNIPKAAQCALRWVAHHNRMKEVKQFLKDDLLHISYETFIKETEQVIGQLQQFIGVSAPIPIPKVKTSSLDKWKTNLTANEIAEIKKVVENSKYEQTIQS